MSDDPGAKLRAQAYAEALQRSGTKAEVVLTQPGYLNRKATQLAQLPKHTQEGLIVCLDSDVLPASVDLTGMVAALQGDPKVGAIWQPVVPQQQAATWGDRVAQAVLAGSGHAMPLLAQIDGASAVGKVILYAPGPMVAAGGWGPCAAALGDDIALSQNLARAGYRVRAHLGRPARDVRRGQSLSSVIARLSRWFLAVRRQRPSLLWAYPLYLFAMPGQVALCALAWHEGADALRSTLLATISIGSRIALGRLARARCEHESGIGRAISDVLLADAAIAVAFIRATTRRTALWHGRQLLPRR